MGSIFHRFREPFGLIFSTFWHHFSILFRRWFSVKFLMCFLSDFGRKYAPGKRSQGSLFSIFFRPFLWPWFLYRFLVDLGSIFELFKHIFNTFSHNVSNVYLDFGIEFDYIFTWLWDSSCSIFEICSVICLNNFWYFT